MLMNILQYLSKGTYRNEVPLPPKLKTWQAFANIEKSTQH